jgi:hypothetical protein
MALNLGKLIRTPGVDASEVRMALLSRFEAVIVDEIHEPFFSHRLRCVDRSGIDRLFVRFGWKMSKSLKRSGWVFEITPVKRFFHDSKTKCSSQ